MLVCRIWRCRWSSAATMLMRWPRRLVDTILMKPNNPEAESLTSTSANQDLLSAAASCLFTDSRHSTSCCSSLTNSIAAPTMEAWSPYQMEYQYMFSNKLKRINIYVEYVPCWHSRSAWETLKFGDARSSASSGSSRPRYESFSASQFLRCFSPSSSCPWLRLPNLHLRLSWAASYLLQLTPSTTRSLELVMAPFKIKNVAMAKKRYVSGFSHTLKSVYSDSDLICVLM